MLVMAAVQEELGDLEGVPVGIGPVIAAATAGSILAQRRPDAVILIGTCGSYAGGPPIGTAVVADRLGLAFGVAAMGLGYVPRPPGPIACDPDLMARIALPRFSVLTCGAVTTDLTLAERLADGWQCEHLEAYGVATACHAAGIPFLVVLGVTNRVGPDAHVEWLTHREHAQEVARAAVRPLLGL
jgi:purine-nucleoside phosphorylase